MATLVKFLKHSEGDLFAYFPQLNYAKMLYGNSQKTCYAHIGQHGACDVAYANECTYANSTEYSALKEELISIGYDLKILNKH